MGSGFDVSRVNWDLLVPFVVIFMLMRLDIQQKLLCGLRFFIPSSLKAYLFRVVEPSSELHKDAVAVFKPLQHSLLEVDNTYQKKHLISHMPFFAFYKIVVLVGFATVLVHLWYESYHCVAPNAGHVSWGIFLAVSLLMLSLQCQLNILLMTGLKVFESKASFYTGILVFVVSVFMLSTFDTVMGFDISGTVDEMAIHINVLMRQTSAKPIQFPILLLSQFLKLIVAAMFGMITASLIVPILRFTQMFISVHYGVESGSTSIPTKILMWMDIFGPLVLAVLYFPLTWNFVSRLLPSSFFEKHYLCPDGQDCAAVRDSTNVVLALAPIAQALRMTVVAIVVLVRLNLIKPYLQKMLDGTVRMVLALIKFRPVDDTNRPLFQDRLKRIGEYLPAGASQLLTFPFVIIAFAVLIHRLSPQGTGTCIILRSMMDKETESVMEAAKAVVQFDATQHARDLAVAPYFNQGIYQFLMGAGMGGESPSRLLAIFISRASHLYVLPPPVAMELLQGLCAFTCLMQFVLTVCAIWYWRRPLTVSGSQVEGDDSSGQDDSKKSD